MRNIEYQGWYNWETWCANLHITNDQGLNDDFEECIRNASDKGAAAKAVEAMVDDWLSEFTDYQKRRSFGLFLDDIIGGFLQDVNWYEMVEGCWDEVRVDQMKDISDDAIEEFIADFEGDDNYQWIIKDIPADDIKSAGLYEIVYAAAEQRFKSRDWEALILPKYHQATIDDAVEEAMEVLTEEDENVDDENTPIL